MANHRCTAKAILGLTHCHSLEQVLQECLVVDTLLDDLLVVREVDQHCERIFSDQWIIFDQELEIADRLERVAFEETGLSGTESNQVLGSCKSSQVSVV